MEINQRMDYDPYQKSKEIRYPTYDILGRNIFYIFTPFILATSIANVQTCIKIELAK